MPATHPAQRRHHSNLMGHNDSRRPRTSVGKVGAHAACWRLVRGTTRREGLDSSLDTLACYRAGMPPADGDVKGLTLTRYAGDGCGRGASVPEGRLRRCPGTIQIAAERVEVEAARLTQVRLVTRSAWGHLGLWCHLFTMTRHPDGPRQQHLEWCSQKNQPFCATSRIRLKTWPTEGGMQHCTVLALRHTRSMCVFH